MEIFPNALPWILACCIFALLLRSKFENISLKNNNKILQNNISQQIQDLSIASDKLLLEKIELEKEKYIFKINKNTYEKNIQKTLSQLFRITTESLHDNFFKASENFILYPELKFSINNFSVKEIAKNTITESIQYKEYKQRKIKSSSEDNGVSDSITHGYIYAMYNLSMPGVVKIGCSDAPNIRAKELTAGEDFRSNKIYAQCKKDFDKYYIGSNLTKDNILGEYVQNLNLRLKTSLPSPFIVAFFFESFEAYNDECLLHFALKDFNVYRGAGTEFFALSLHQVYDVFKSFFPNRAYQYPNFTPPK